MLPQLKYGPYRVPVTLAAIQGLVTSEWAGIIERLVIDLFNMGWNGEVLQVKAKFGELRFYIGDDRTEEMWERICRATVESRAGRNEM